MGKVFRPGERFLRDELLRCLRGGKGVPHWWVTPERTLAMVEDGEINELEREILLDAAKHR